MRFLFVATLVSGLVGLPLLLSLSEISAIGGTAATGLIGCLMLVTGYLQLRRSKADHQVRDNLTLADALLVGVAQGLAVIPGLSRSGMTVAVLILRQVDRKRALTLSFLLSIPASLAASLYVGVDSGLVFDAEAILAAGVAFVVGLLTIRGLLAAAARVNFGWFVVAVGAVMIAGSLVVWLL